MACAANQGVVVCGTEVCRLGSEYIRQLANCIGIEEYIVSEISVFKSYNVFVHIKMNKMPQKVWKKEVIFPRKVWQATVRFLRTVVFLSCLNGYWHHNDVV